MHHGLSPHQIVKGQWFTTVKVRNDPEPRFPETGLETGVEDVEVGLSDDVAVSTRAAILRLREQTFILVERMDENVQAVLFQHSSQPHRLMFGARSTAPADRVKPGGKLSHGRILVVTITHARLTSGVHASES